MDETNIIRLYQVLCAYSAGFYGAVLEPTHNAKHKHQLIELVVQTYAKLFDEALGLSFHSEMADTMGQGNGASAVIQEMSKKLENSQAEHQVLQVRGTWLNSMKLRSC